MSNHYSDEKDFRASNGGGEILELTRGRFGVVISIDSYDAPEQSLRLNAETVTALAIWLANTEPTS